MAADGGLRGPAAGRRDGRGDQDQPGAAAVDGPGGRRGGGRGRDRQLGSPAGAAVPARPGDGQGRRRGRGLDRLEAGRHLRRRHPVPGPPGRGVGRGDVGCPAADDRGPAEERAGLALRLAARARVAERRLRPAAAGDGGDRLAGRPPAAGPVPAREPDRPERAVGEPAEPGQQGGVADRAGDRVLRRLLARGRAGHVRVPGGQEEAGAELVLLRRGRPGGDGGDGGRREAGAAGAAGGPAPDDDPRRPGAAGDRLLPVRAVHPPATATRRSSCSGRRPGS